MFESFDLIPCLSFFSGEGIEATKLNNVRLKVIFASSKKALAEGVTFFFNVWSYG